MSSSNTNNRQPTSIASKPSIASPKVIILGKYSPSQNGVIVSPLGIAPCIAGGGKGHDTDKPKILITYE